MPQLLLEIFSEEIPARMQGGAARDLERMASERLKAAGLSWDSLTTWAGPRRLTLVVEGLPAATPDQSEELKGPRMSAPPQALEGFLRKTGLSQDQLTERDGVWFAQVDRKGQGTAQVVAEMVEQVVRGFPWPKSMRWGTGTLRWVRPIKRIVCLFDGAVVPFEIDGIASGDVTEGHRFMGSGKAFSVKDFADYRKKLEQHFVLLDATDRRLRILEQAKAACAARGLVLVDDDGLLDEVAGLAEWPTPILGEMDPQFLDLPPEVVRLSMKVHQKYFAVRRPDGQGLAPNFVVVANIEASDGGAALAAGNARVLSARLNDARFFWDEDRKVGFDAWLKKLEGVTFHAKLGTMAQRVERIAALARAITPLVGADPEQAEAAARLAKADLASGMVGEFPELQGVMGGYYARAAGQPDIIADAVRDHYRPQGPGDTVPTAPLTVAVALADKLDTLVGFFAIDEKPTGSKDPYALRRAALGVIRLVLENGVRMNLHELVEAHSERLAEQIVRVVRTGATKIVRSQDSQSAGTHQTSKRIVVEQAGVELGSWHDDGTAASSQVANDHAQTRRAVLRAEAGMELPPFVQERLKVSERDQGKRPDLIDAARFADDDLVRIVARVEALDAFLTTDDGANLLAGFKRASNILRAEAKKGELPVGMVQTGLPGQPEEEAALAFAAAAAAASVDAALETEDFAGAMAALAGLRAPVDAFFDKVLVNADDPTERDNRLRLLGQVRGVMGRVADFSLIAG